MNTVTILTFADESGNRSPYSIVNLGKTPQSLTRREATDWLREIDRSAEPRGTILTVAFCNDHSECSGPEDHYPEYQYVVGHRGGVRRESVGHRD